jgi:hypothetical protein
MSSGHIAVTVVATIEIAVGTVSVHMILRSLPVNSTLHLEHMSYCIQHVLTAGGQQANIIDKRQPFEDGDSCKIVQFMLPTEWKHLWQP